VDNPFKSPTILSLCTGIGGIERGLERALGKINVAAYVEIETFIIENLLSGMESGLVAPAPIWTDLKTFPHEGFYGKIHGIIGGYPCQPFSVAGNQKGTEDPRHLFPFILEIVRSVRPVWCFFENVSGHLSLGYDEVYRSLHDLGYRIEAGIFTAEEVGAPHQRERLFILALDDTRFIGQAFKKLTTAGIEQSGKELGNAIGDGYSGRHPKSGSENGRCKSGRLQQLEGTGSELADSNGNGFNRDSKYFENTGKSDQERWAECLETCNTFRTDNETKELPENETGIGKLVNPESGRCQQRDQRFRNIQQSDKGCDVMANTNSQTKRRSENRDQRWKVYQNFRFDRNGFRCKFEGCSQNVSNSTGFRTNQSRNQSESEFTYQDGITGRTQFPSRPNQPQYEWEEPRTVKSGMGSTINGYNFREDLLRAFGNAVVEQTAELAFITLLKKHGIEL